MASIPLLFFVIVFIAELAMAAFAKVVIQDDDASVSHLCAIVVLMFAQAACVLLYIKRNHENVFMGTHYSWTRGYFGPRDQDRRDVHFAQVPWLMGTVRGFQAMQEGLNYLLHHRTEAESARALAYTAMTSRATWFDYQTWGEARNTLPVDHNLKRERVRGDPVPGLSCGLALTTTDVTREAPSYTTRCLHIIFADQDKTFLDRQLVTKLVSVDKAVYGTKGCVASHFYESIHADVELIKAAVERMQKDFPRDIVAVCLYGRFVGAMHAVQATLAVTTLKEVYVTTYTEGCNPILDCTAVNDLRSRIAPRVLDPMVQILDEEGEEGEEGAGSRCSPAPSFFLNNICLFNVVHADDAIPYTPADNLWHHATPIVVGETRDGAHRRLTHTLSKWGEFKTIAHRILVYLQWQNNDYMYTRAMADLVRGKTKTAEGQEVEVWPASTYGFLDNLLSGKGAFAAPVHAPVPVSHPTVAHLLEHGGKVCVDGAGAGRSEDEE